MYNLSNQYESTPEVLENPLEECKRFYKKASLSTMHVNHKEAKNPCATQELANSNLNSGNELKNITNFNFDSSVCIDSHQNSLYANSVNNKKSNQHALPLAVDNLNASCLQNEIRQYSTPYMIKNKPTFITQEREKHPKKYQFRENTPFAVQRSQTETKSYEECQINLLSFSNRIPQNSSTPDWKPSQNQTSTKAVNDFKEEVLKSERKISNWDIMQILVSSEETACFYDKEFSPKSKSDISDPLETVTTMSNSKENDESSQQMLVVDPMNSKMSTSSTAKSKFKEGSRYSCSVLKRTQDFDDTEKTILSIIVHKIKKICGFYKFKFWKKLFSSSGRKTKANMSLYNYDSRVLPKIPLKRSARYLLSITELPFIILWVYFVYWCVIVAMTVNSASITIWFSATIAGILVGIGLNANAYDSIRMFVRKDPLETNNAQSFNFLSQNESLSKNAQNEDSNRFLLEILEKSDLTTLNKQCSYCRPMSEYHKVLNWGMIIRFFLIPFAVSSLSGLTNSNRQDFLLVFPVDPFYLSIALICPTTTAIFFGILRFIVLWRLQVRWTVQVLFLNGTLTQ